MLPRRMKNQTLIPIAAKYEMTRKQPIQGRDNRTHSTIKSETTMTHHKDESNVDRIARVSRSATGNPPMKWNHRNVVSLGAPCGVMMALTDPSVGAEWIEFGLDQVPHRVAVWQR